MKLELKNIKEAKFLSQETPAYTATLYVDGKKAATVENDGHGGCDYAHFIDRAVEEKVYAYFKALPKLKFDDTELDHTLELWCHRQLNIRDVVAGLKRKAKKCVVAVTEDGGEITWKGISPQFLPAHRETLLQKKPGVKFVSEMSDAELHAFVSRILENEI